MSTEPHIPDDATPQVKNLEFKAGLLLALLAVLVVGSGLYLLYARGVFESTQRLVLVADDSDGVVVGMDLTFSGFPIGRVRRIELADEGKAHILIDVASKDSKWLRKSSVFTLERSIVGAPKLRAFTGMLQDEPLPDGAQRDVLAGDLAAEIPRLMGTVRDLAQNLSNMTAQDAPLNATLANVQAVTDRLKGPGGGLGVLMGGDAETKKLISVLDNTNALLVRMDALAAKTDSLVARTDTQVFGPEGVMKEVRATVIQLNGVLSDTRESLKKVDAVLVEAQGVGANARAATADLGLLRADVESSLRKVDALVNEINRKWPFARDTEVKVP
jgi:phospholipid/cholesterol/gamma-HCH transport system substrate-binding protein